MSDEPKLIARIIPDSISADEYNAIIAKERKRPKYGNQQVIHDGIVFDSKAELRRYLDLETMRAADKIRDIELQPKFPIVVNGKRIGNYFADFTYFDVERGVRVVEDVKGGQSTAVYRLKKRLVEAIYGVVIREIRPYE